MKYSTTIHINKPILKVVTLFDNPKNYIKWMEGLQDMELIEGQAGQEQAKTRFHFKMGKRDMHMLETVLTRKLPYLYITAYESGPVYNIVENHFKALDKNTTSYTTVHEFQFKGLMKLMGWLMPNAFKKQSRKYLNDFKNFVESN